MRERHWTLLSEQLGTPLHPGKDFTLVKAEEMQLLQHLAVITKVADVAGKEFSIEQVGGRGGGSEIQIQIWGPSPCGQLALTPFPHLHIGTGQDAA